MKKTLLLLALFSTLQLAAQGPEVTSWKLNLNGQVGYAGILTNVQQVQYGNNNVYVSCTCIPDYNIGPWQANPNIPVNQNFVFKITRNPVVNNGTKTATGLGHIGTWSNGVSIFNAKDGMSYNNQNIWHRDALYYEGVSFDACLGHPAPNGEYHNHVNPTCLYNDLDDQMHSPIIGYAFDGFPIYGAYGYTDPNDPNSGFSRMRTSYRKRNIAVRQTLPDGTQLPANQYGPAVGVQYPLGAYIEDYEYVAGLGDLDPYNGRICVTPDYPNGIYAYFVTIDSVQYPVYPYVLGPSYYGVVQQGNTGPNGGHNVPAEPVVTYNPAVGINTPFENLDLQAFPNPTSEFVGIDFTSMGNVAGTVSLFNSNGQAVKTASFSGGMFLNIPVADLANGLYHVRIQMEDGQEFGQNIVKF